MVFHASAAWRWPLKSVLSFRRPCDQAYCRGRFVGTGYFMMGGPFGGIGRESGGARGFGRAEGLAVPGFFLPEASIYYDPSLHPDEQTNKNQACRHLLQTTHRRFPVTNLTEGVEILKARLQRCFENRCKAGLYFFFSFFLKIRGPEGGTERFGARLSGAAFFFRAVPGDLPEKDFAILLNRTSLSDTAPNISRRGLDCHISGDNRKWRFLITNASARR